MSSGDIEFQNRAIDKNVKKVYRHFTVLITPGHMLLGNIYVSGWKRAQKSSRQFMDSEHLINANLFDKI